MVGILMCRKLSQNCYLETHLALCVAELWQFPDEREQSKASPPHKSVSQEEIDDLLWEVEICHIRLHSPLNRQPLADDVKWGWEEITHLVTSLLRSQKEVENDSKKRAKQSLKIFVKNGALVDFSCCMTLLQNVWWNYLLKYPANKTGQ